MNLDLEKRTKDNPWEVWATSAIVLHYSIDNPDARPILGNFTIPKIDYVLRIEAEGLLTWTVRVTKDDVTEYRDYRWPGRFGIKYRWLVEHPLQGWVLVRWAQKRLLSYGDPIRRLWYQERVAKNISADTLEVFHVIGSDRLVFVYTGTVFVSEKSASEILTPEDKPFITALAVHPINVY